MVFKRFVAQFAIASLTYVNPLLYTLDVYPFYGTVAFTHGREIIGFVTNAARHPKYKNKVYNIIFLIDYVFYQRTGVERPSCA